MKKQFLSLAFALILAGLPFFANAQDTSSQPKGDIGLEIQVYPTGVIPGIRGALSLGNREELHLRLGAQFIDHRDLGKHEDETGTGAGFTLGYRHYFKDGQKGLFLGARNDIWFNKIDWLDNIGLPTERIGQTNIVVVQPTAEAGYLFELGENWTLAPALGFGFEVNVSTDGEDTGEGAILLVGIAFGYRFR